MTDTPIFILPLDHNNGADALIAHIIRMYAVVASGQPVADSDAENPPEIRLTGHEITLFLDELEQYIWCKFKRYAHVREMFLPMIRTVRQGLPDTIIVSTVVAPEGSRTIVHLWYFAAPDAAEVGRQTLTYYLNQLPAFRSRHGLAAA